MSTAIDVAGVSKSFHLQGEKAMSLKERVVRRSSRAPSSDFWALRDIDLRLEEGATVGLLGHNGSGKSTLLKLIGGILRPTSGTIAVRGRVASLLELGAGFHPELTGRENIFINGAILGLSQRELRRRFDEIVEFAELEQFIDTQVRNYSSGMYTRLGFAVAVNVEPDILLIDEVLAVGDENFQRKCLDRIHQLQRSGLTIVIVSHGTDDLRRICDRIVVLDHGRLVGDGKPGDAIRVFREHMLADQRERQADIEARHRHDAPEADEPPSDAVDDSPAQLQPEGGALPSAPAAPLRRAVPASPLSITGIEVDHPHRADRAFLHPGEPLTLRIGFNARQPVEDVMVGIALYDHSDGRHLFGVNTQLLDVPLPVLHGVGEVLYEIEAVPLLDGTYPIVVEFSTRDGGTVYDRSEQQHWFEVMNPDRRVGTVAFDVSVKVTASLPEAGPADEAAPVPASDG